MEIEIFTSCGVEEVELAGGNREAKVFGRMPHLQETISQHREFNKANGYSGSKSIRRSIEAWEEGRGNEAIAL